MKKDILELVVVYMYYMGAIFGLAYLFNEKIIGSIISILITTVSYYVLKYLNRN